MNEFSFGGVAMYDEDDWSDEGKEADVYSQAERENLVEDDIISAEEEAFMRGWEEAMEEPEETELEL
tara:strand:+ start:4478 stop:4678 length:201 start_codon:yes stop_codon:yes gene_type:complete